MDGIDMPLVGEFRSDGSGKLTELFRQGQGENEIRFTCSAEEDSKLVKMLREAFFQAGSEVRH